MLTTELCTFAHTHYEAATSSGIGSVVEASEGEAKRRDASSCSLVLRSATVCSTLAAAVAVVRCIEAMRAWRPPVSQFACSHIVLRELYIVQYTSMTYLTQGQLQMTPFKKN